MPPLLFIGLQLLLGRLLLDLPLKLCLGMFQGCLLSSLLPCFSDELATVIMDCIVIGVDVKTGILIIVLRDSVNVIGVVIPLPFTSVDVLIDKLSVVRAVAAHANGIMGIDVVIVGFII